MKNLTIIRHGKAGYELGLSDKQRILNSRGIDNSILVAKKYLPYLKPEYQIVSSSANRAFMTAEIFARIFEVSEDKIVKNNNLYTFDGDELAEIIKQTDNNVTNLLIFGHNDGITDFVNKFGDLSIDNVPTSGLVSINFETNNWANIKNGHIIKTIFPNEQ
ncbi:MAG: histidine phosphatase family protein [Flavobacterium sp.]|nr:histidine phosphatase family protein [Flavobacterium sp.]